MKYYYALGRGAGTSNHPSIQKSNISQKGEKKVRGKMKNAVFITMKTGYGNINLFGVDIGRKNL